MPELTLQIKSAADLTAFKQAQAAATNLNKTVSGSSSSDVGKAARAASHDFKGLSKSIHGSSVNVSDLKSALAGVGQGMNLGPTIGQVIGLTAAMQVMFKLMAVVPRKTSLSSSIGTFMGRGHGENMTLSDMHDIHRAVTGQQSNLKGRARIFSRQQIPTLMSGGVGVLAGTAGIIAAGTAGLTKAGTMLSDATDIKGLIGDAASGYFKAWIHPIDTVSAWVETVGSSKLYKSVENFFAGIDDLLEEQNVNAINNLDQQAKSGTSNKARSVAISGLEFQLKNDALTDETKAEIRKQIENIQSGKAAETYYKVNVGSLQDARKEELQVQAGRGLSRQIGMSAMEDNLKKAQDALNAALDANNVALAAEAKVNLAKQENLMEGARIALEEERMSKEATEKAKTQWDAMKAALERFNAFLTNQKVKAGILKQESDDNKKVKAGILKQESDDNKKLLLDRVRRNFATPGADGKAPPYSDDMRRVGLIMGGSPNAQTSIAASTAKTAVSTAMIARLMSSGTGMLTNPNYNVSTGMTSAFNF